jgi:predicted nucleic acid-binding protein
MKIYLDLCCFNRPFDDQSQLLVRLQTEAKLAIQESVRNGVHHLVWSAILDLENVENPDPERTAAIAEWSMLAGSDIHASILVEEQAKKLQLYGLKAIDSLHVASAIVAGAEYFLTTDKGILRKSKSIAQITVVDPIDFVRESYGAPNED